MYKLPYFTEENKDKVIAFMHQHSFAVIAGQGSDFPVATQIPLAIHERPDGSLFFSGHLMKGTDHHKCFENNPNVLVIFSGPNCYVSASWYQQQAVASTWNYISVHAHGTISFTDEAGTMAAIRAITDKYEGADGPSSFDKLPPAYISRLVKAIVGFEIDVIKLENVFKLSQNHDAKDREEIIRHLSNGDEQSKLIAIEMQNKFSGI